MKAAKQTIIWLAHEAEVSGANLCIKEFMQVAAEAGFEQLLIIPHTGSMESVASELNVPCKVVHYYPWVRKLNSGFFDALFFKRGIRNIISILQLVSVLKKNKADMVFTNTSVINVGAWAAFIARKKHYWYIHEMGEEDFGFKLPWGKLSYWFMRIASDKVLTNSFHLAAKYKNKDENLTLDVVRYPVFVSTHTPVQEWKKDTEVKLLLLGQVSETKGHLTAIEAVHQLKEAGYQIQLSIVGNCESDLYKQKLNVKIQQSGLQEMISFIDYTDNPANVIAGHHILLMCSRCEAFGRVTVEAMKIGVPVAGSNTCGTKEIISHMETGYLFEQGNAASLYAGIKELIDNSGLRNNIIKQAKESAEKLTGKGPFVSLLQQV